MDNVFAVSARFGALLDAIEEERSRLARHLHDTIAQNLAAVSMHLAMIEATVREPKATETILECSNLLEDSIRDIRATSYLLEPPLVAELGVNASLKTFADIFGAVNGIGLELDADAAVTDQLSPAVQLAIFRIVQDSANGMATAGALDIRVQVILNADSVVITISGRCGTAGIDLRQSLGWAIVQERAARHDWRALLAGGGSMPRIEIVLPVEKNAK